MSAICYAQSQHSTCLLWYRSSRQWCRCIVRMKVTSILPILHTSLLQWLPMAQTPFLSAPFQWLGDLSPLLIHGLLTYGCDQQTQTRCPFSRKFPKNNAKIWLPLSCKEMTSQKFHSRCVLAPPIRDPNLVKTGQGFWPKKLFSPLLPMEAL